MKKEYKVPFIYMMEAETEEMIALSMVSDGFADSSDALSRESSSWPASNNLWADDEE